MPSPQSNNNLENGAFTLHIFDGRHLWCLLEAADVLVRVDSSGVQVFLEVGLEYQGKGAAAWVLSLRLSCHL